MKRKNKNKMKNNMFVVFAGVEAIECNLEPKNNEARIKKAILCNYDKSARPTLTDGPIKLKFRMIVKGFNFDASTNKMTVSTWLAMVMNCTYFNYVKTKISDMRNAFHSHSPTSRYQYFFCASFSHFCL